MGIQDLFTCNPLNNEINIQMELSTISWQIPDEDVHRLYEHSEGLPHTMQTHRKHNTLTTRIKWARVAYTRKQNADMNFLIPSTISNASTMLNQQRNDFRLECHKFCPDKEINNVRRVHELSNRLTANSLTNKQD